MGYDFGAAMEVWNVCIIYLLGQMGVARIHRLREFVTV